jgi:hypothetical protein
MKQIASDRDGKCLSEEYINATTKITWECSEGHIWDAIPNNIKRGSWCPHCLWKTETACREIIEELIGKPFPKLRARWLQGLELDGYCIPLKLAFEYQGEQHYKLITPWHKNGEEDLQKQQERDRRKLTLCRAHGVHVIVIPYWVKDKREFIRTELLHIIRLRRHAMTKMSNALAEELYPHMMTNEISKELYS